MGGEARDEVTDGRVEGEVGPVPAEGGYAARRQREVERSPALLLLEEPVGLPTGRRVSVCVHACVRACARSCAPVCARLCTLVRLRERK